MIAWHRLYSRQKPANIVSRFFKEGNSLLYTVQRAEASQHGSIAFSRKEDSKTKCIISRTIMPAESQTRNFLLTGLTCLAAIRFRHTPYVSSGFGCLSAQSPVQEKCHQSLTRSQHGYFAKDSSVQKSLTAKKAFLNFSVNQSTVLKPFFQHCGLTQFSLPSQVIQLVIGFELSVKRTVSR